MASSNPYTRHIKPKKPEGPLMKTWGFIAAALVFLCFGIFQLLYQSVSRNRFGMKRSAFRDIEDL